MMEWQKQNFNEAEETLETGSCPELERQSVMFWVHNILNKVHEWTDT